MKIRGTFYNILKTNTLNLGCVKRSHMRRWELFLIVVVENGGHIHLCFKLQNDSTISLHIDKDSLIALQ